MMVVSEGEKRMMRRMPFQNSDERFPFEKELPFPMIPVPFSMLLFRGTPFAWELPCR